MFGDEDTYVKPSQINEDTDDYDRVYARMRELRVKMNQDLAGQKWYDPVSVSDINHDKKLPEVKKTPIADTKKNHSCDECQKMRSQLELIKTTLLNLANCIDLPPEKLPPVKIIAEKNIDVVSTIDEIPLPKYTHEELIAKKYVDISGCNIIEMSSDDLLS